MRGESVVIEQLQYLVNELVLHLCQEIGLWEHTISCLVQRPLRSRRSTIAAISHMLEIERSAMVTVSLGSSFSAIRGL